MLDKMEYIDKTLSEYTCMFNVFTHSVRLSSLSFRPFYKVWHFYEEAE